MAHQEVTTTDDIRSVLGAPERMKLLKNFLGSDEDARKFGSAVVYAMDSTPKLRECTQDSLISAFMKCAELRIYPSSVSGEAFVLPYEKKKQVAGKWVTDYVQAQFQLGYQGIVTLLYRAGTKVGAQIVRENDEFEYSEGFETTLVHKPLVFGDRGQPKGAYAVALLRDGTKVCKVMSKADIEKIKGMSKAANSDHSPWNSASDPELWMWKKTVVKQLAKLLPKTEELNQAIALDNEDTDFALAKKEAMKHTLERPSEIDVTSLIPGAPAAEAVTKKEVGVSEKQPKTSSAD